MTTCFRILCVLLGMVLAGPLPDASAFQEDEYKAITPRSVQGDGAYNHDLELIIDGRFAEEGSPWLGDRCVFWEDDEAFFILDLGAEYLVQDVLLQVDDNDIYTVEYSTDASNYLPLYVFYEGYGSVEAGLETLSSDPGHADHVPVPDRDPVPARYLRVSASSGDGRYALAEFQVYGYVQAPPEVSPDVLLNPESVQGFGEFRGAADVLIDGYTPAEGSSWEGDTCVSWADPDVYFLIDLGRILEVTGVQIQIHSGQGYRIDYSLDNVIFISLLELRGTGGDVASGMDTVSTRPSDPEYVTDRDFFPVQARFLKVYGFDGRGPFAVSEILIYGPAGFFRP